MFGEYFNNRLRKYCIPCAPIFFIPRDTLDTESSKKLSPILYFLLKTLRALRNLKSTRCGTELL